MQRPVPLAIPDGIVRARRPRGDGVRGAGGGERRRRPAGSGRGRGDRFPHTERGCRGDDRARPRGAERYGAPHAVARRGRAAGARVCGRAHRTALRAAVRGRPRVIDVLRLVRVQNLVDAAVGVLGGGWIALGAIADARPKAGSVPWTLAIWLHRVREIVKDLDDEAGDRELGRRTLPIRLGQRRATVIAAVLAAAFVPLSLALPAASHYAGAYFVIALFAQLVVLAVASRLFAGRSAGNSRWLKGAMLLGVVALVAGRVA